MHSLFKIDHYFKLQSWWAVKTNLILKTYSNTYFMRSACWKQHTSIYIFPPKKLVGQLLFSREKIQKKFWVDNNKYPRMRYISTRGKESGLTFEKVLFSGKKEYVFYIYWVCNLAFYFLLKILWKYIFIYYCTFRVRTRWRLVFSRIYSKIG